MKAKGGRKEGANKCKSDNNREAHVENRMIMERFSESAKLKQTQTLNGTCGSREYSTCLKPRTAELPTLESDLGWRFAGFHDKDVFELPAWRPSSSHSPLCILQPRIRARVKLA